MMQILGFSVPVCFRGHFEEIGITKLLLRTKPRHNSFGVSVLRSLRKCSEKKMKERKKETSVKYNGLHALATLERMTYACVSDMRKSVGVHLH